MECLWSRNREKKHGFTRASVLKTVFKLLTPYRTRVWIAAIALIIAALCMLTIGQGLRFVIDKGLVANNSDFLDLTLLIMIAIIVVLALSTYIRFYFVSWLGERVTADLRQQLFSHLLTLEPAFFEERRTGELITRITSDTAQLEVVIGTSVSMALRNILLLMGGVIMMLITNIKLTLLVLLSVPLVVVPILFFGGKVRKFAKLSQDRLAVLGTMLDESIHEIRIVQAYVHEQEDQKHFHHAVERSFDAAKARFRQRAGLIAIILILVFSAIALMLWVGGHDVLSGRLSAGDLSAFLFYAVVVAGAFAAISEVLGDLQRATGATERLLEILATKPTITSPIASPIAKQDGYQTLQQGHLSFERVSFYYPSRAEQFALAELNLEIPAGSQLALVGPSGSGKSTLFQLLLRFYDPQQGIIRLNGIDIKELSPQYLRQHIAIVTQDPIIFAGSVFDNVRYGKLDADEAMVKAACQAAFAHEFIEQLPQQYHSYLGERGVRLSGGQKQRIAIARAILADRPILLLDEATSALDNQSERVVQDALNVLMKGRTTLVIAHRLSTVEHMPRILIVDQGKIIGDGTHHELLNDNAMYQQLALRALS